MKKFSNKLAVYGGALALVTSTHAAVSVFETGGTSGWALTPGYISIAAGTPSSYTVNEGSWGSGGTGTNGALSQSFMLSSGGQLDSIQLVIGGAAATTATFNLTLYDLGAYPGSGYPATGASYAPASLAGSQKLSSSLQFTYTGLAGGGAQVVKLAFTGADAVSLSANELYAFQLDRTANDTVQWYRSGGVVSPIGEMYRMSQFSAGNMGALNGAIREAGFALNLAPVPEASSLALMSGGLAALGLIRRAKK